ncbi:unnamed protein product [Sympodiomycopsis kandeliae]
MGDVCSSPRDQWVAILKSWIRSQAEGLEIANAEAIQRILAQPLQNLDNCIPARSHDGCTLVTRLEAILPAFEQAMQELINSQQEGNYKAGLTVLVTAYLLLQPYQDGQERLSLPQATKGLPFYSDIETGIERLNRYPLNSIQGKVRRFLIDLLNNIERVKSQSTLQLLDVQANVSLDDLISVNDHLSSTTDLLQYASQRTLSLAETRLLLDTIVDVEDVSSTQQVTQLAEQNPKIAVRLLTLYMEASETDKVNSILSSLGAQAIPNNTRSMDLFLRLSQTDSLPNPTATLALPTYLSRCFDHIRSSERASMAMESENDNDLLLSHKDIPYSIQQLIGFMNQVGFVNPATTTMDQHMREIVENFAIEIKAFALDLVRYKAAHELLKRLM